MRYRPGRDEIDLKGKRILLTGASSGIGEAAAEKFARRGATVVVVARRKELLDELVGRITAGDGGNAQAMTAIFADLDAVDELVATVERDLGGVDILINNAGRSIRRPLAESLERWHDVERTMGINYYSPLRLIRGLAPGMLERGDGHIINVVHLGRAQRIVAAVRGLQRVEGCTLGGQPDHRDGVVATRECTRRRCTTHWCHTDDRADARPTTACPG